MGFVNRPLRWRLYLTIAVLLSSCAAAQNPSNVSVRSVTTSRQGSDLRIQITLSATVKPSVETAVHPNRILLDFPNTVCYSNTKNVPVRANGVRQVRTAQHSSNPNVTRVVLDMDEVRPYAVTAEGTSIILTVAGEEKRVSHGAPVSATSGNILAGVFRHRDGTGRVMGDTSKDSGSSLPLPPSAVARPEFQPRLSNSTAALSPPPPLVAQPHTTAQPQAIAEPQTAAAAPPTSTPPATFDQNHSAVAPNADLSTGVSSGPTPSAAAVPKAEEKPAEAAAAAAAVQPQPAGPTPSAPATASSQLAAAPNPAPVEPIAPKPEEKMAEVPAAAAGGALPAGAQAGTSVNGRVVDPSGAVIVGMELSLINRTTGETRRAATGGDGNFTFANVPVGTYVLRGDMEDFKSINIPVTAERSPVQLNVVLKIAHEEEVTVTSEQESVAPDQNADAVRFDDRLFTELPTESQDIIPLLSNFLSPAAQGTEGVSIVVDGVETDELDVPTSSIKSVVINTNPYSAEFRRPGKGRVEITTKEASRRHYHGGLALFARNSMFDARIPFSKSEPHLNRDLAQADLSGPLVRKRATFLLSGTYLTSDDTKVVNALTLSGPLVENVPTSQRRTNLFARFDFYPTRRHTVAAFYKFDRQADRNQSAGGLNLAEQGSSSNFHENKFEVSDQFIVSPRLLNNLRLIFWRARPASGSPSTEAEIQVIGAFTGGGSPIFRGDQQTVVHLDDSGSYSRGGHNIQFGARSRPKFVRAYDQSNFAGIFQFFTLADFQNQKPFIFQINRGQPNVSFTETDVSGYVQDTMKLGSHASLLLGARYDWQSAINERRNFAPRAAIALAPSHTTVIRAGAGLFFERLSESAFERALLHSEGKVQQLVFFPNPSFPDPYSSGQTPLPSLVQLAPGFTTPYVLDASLSVEQEIRKNTHLTVDFQTLRGVHLFRSHNINAPDPVTGLRPNPQFFAINQVESSATMRGNSANVTLRSTVKKRLNLLAQYTFSHTTDDTSGTFALPANNYDLGAERGRSNYDRRHRFSLVGSAHLGLGFKLGAVLTASSGPPFDITTGYDGDDDGVANDRPAGITRNTGQGPGTLQLDVRLGKAFRVPRLANRDRTSRNLEFNVDAFNVVNHTNLNNYVGIETSPFFGKANSAVPARTIQLSSRYHF